MRSRGPGRGIAAMSCKLAQEKGNGVMILLEHYVRSSGDETIEGVLKACRLRCGDGRVRAKRIYGWTDSAGVIVLSGRACVLG